MPDYDRAYDIDGPKDPRCLYGGWTDACDATFGPTLAALTEQQAMTPTAHPETPIYEVAEHLHRNARVLVVRVRKLRAPPRST